MKNNLIIEESRMTLIAEDKVPYIFVTEFDDSSVIKFYEKFLKLEANPDVKIIPIIISSFGGQVHSLLTMLDLIDASSKPVSTIALGKAMSCGAFLLAGGTRGYRYAAPSTDIMVHEVASGAFGKTTTLQSSVKHTKKLNDNILKFLFERSSLTDKNFIAKQMKKNGNVDWFLTAKEYKRLGLIDHIGVPKLVKK